MRFNDKAVAKLSQGIADLEGILNHMRPQGNEWSDWYQQPCFKERYFKLKGNLLYCYKVNEQDQGPLGVLVLENTHVAYERPQKGIHFVFSLTFKVQDKFRDNEAKHIFSCRCEADVNTWVSALKMSSYEYWRSQRLILRAKLAMKTGKDPILEHLRNNNSDANINMKVEIRKTKSKETRSTFYRQVETNTFYGSSTTSCSSEGIVSSTNNTNETVDNFITF